MVKQAITGALGTGAIESGDLVIGNGWRTIWCDGISATRKR